MRPEPEQYLHGPRGNRIVIVPQAAINALFPPSRLRELRARCRDIDPVTAAVLGAVCMASVERTTVDVRPAAPTPDTASGSSKPMSSREVADRLGIHIRSVTRAAEAGDLRATKDADGRWWTTADDFAEYRKFWEKQ